MPRRVPRRQEADQQRSQYDLKTGRETKTNTHIAFDQTICVDRFLASADKAKREESVEITREMSRVRSRLHQLKNNKVSFLDAFPKSDI